MQESTDEKNDDIKRLEHGRQSPHPADIAEANNNDIKTHAEDRKEHAGKMPAWQKNGKERNNEAVILT